MVSLVIGLVFLPLSIKADLAVAQQTNKKFKSTASAVDRSGSINKDARLFNENNSRIGLLSYGFSNVASAKSSLTTGELALKAVGESSTEELDGPPEIIGRVLNYPNPFVRSLHPSTTIRYVLTKKGEMDVKIYDLQANLIFSETYTSGEGGGFEGPNRLEIDKDMLGGYELSAGVYFYYILHNGKVLGKGKMAVVP